MANRLYSEHRRVVFSALLVLVCGFINSLLRFGDYNYGHNTIIMTIYISVLFQWMFSIRRRFIQRDIRNNLLAAAALMIIWLAQRYIKYIFVNPDSFLNRHLWYLYYLPCVMVPLLMFMSALYIGKSNEYKPDSRWKICYIPAVIVVLGIMTNDIHQLAFKFKPGMVDWNEDYSRGILYYFALAIVICSILGILIIVIRTGMVMDFSRLWLPCVIVAIGIIYILNYSSSNYNEYKAFIQKMYEFPEFSCFFLVAFFESLVFTHLLPSNSGHETFFMISSLRAGLTDEDYNVKLKGRDWEAPKASKIKRACEWPVYIEENRTLLKCQPVSGGYFYWMEDVEELIRLNEKLSETGDYLEEERVMLDEAVRLDESRKSTEEQNRLYDWMNKRLQPQLNYNSDILANLPSKEADFEKSMKYAGILGAYIKRKSNLLLLSGTEQIINSSELRISVEELLSYVGLNGVTFLADIKDGIMLDSSLTLMMFELLEDAIEKAMPGLSAIMVTFNINDNKLLFYIEAAAPTNILDIENERRNLCDKYAVDYSKAFDIKLTHEDECEYISLSVSMTGGDI